MNYALIHTRTMRSSCILATSTLHTHSHHALLLHVSHACLLYTTQLFMPQQFFCGPPVADKLEARGEQPVHMSNAAHANSPERSHVHVMNQDPKGRL